VTEGVKLAVGLGLGLGLRLDKLLRDMDEQGIQADGSTELDRIVRLGLGGWRDKIVY